MPIRPFFRWLWLLDGNQCNIFYSQLKIIHFLLAIDFFVLSNFCNFSVKWNYGKWRNFTKINFFFVFTENAEKNPFALAGKNQKKILKIYKIIPFVKSPYFSILKVTIFFLKNQSFFLFITKKQRINKYIFGRRQINNPTTSKILTPVRGQKKVTIAKKIKITIFLFEHFFYCFLKTLVQKKG